MPATPAVRARLYRESLGWCAMPNCYTELRLDGKISRYIAQAAHIVGEKNTSARFNDQSVPLGDRNKIENLILMCPSHHNEVDADEDKWTVDRLQKLKLEHERHMYLLLQSGRSWKQKFVMIDYINLPRICGMPGGGLLIRACRDAGLTGQMTLRDLGFEVGLIEGSARAILAQWNAKATPLGQIDTTRAEDLVGTIVSFDEQAYTRNCPVQGCDAAITGDLAKDPHIWFKFANMKINIRYDPTWVTTGTAIANLSQGQGRFAGIGIVVAADNDSLLVSALAIGKPMRPDSEAVYRAMSGQ